MLILYEMLVACCLLSCKQNEMICGDNWALVEMVVAAVMATNATVDGAWFITKIPMDTITIHIIALCTFSSAFYLFFIYFYFFSLVPYVYLLSLFISFFLLLLFHFNLICMLDYYEVARGSLILFTVFLQFFPWLLSLFLTFSKECAAWKGQGGGRWQTEMQHSLSWEKL